jgi:hypothetical protein
MANYERSRLREYLTQVAYDEIHRSYSAEKHAKTMVDLYRSICG